MRVYVAGPMSTSGEPGPNLHAAGLVAAWLLERGHAVFVPQAQWVCDAVSPRPATEWLRSDLAWVAVADVVWRLPGDSKGADMETQFADVSGIPVVYGQSDFLELELDEAAKRNLAADYGARGISVDEFVDAAVVARNQFGAPHEIPPMAIDRYGSPPKLPLDALADAAAFRAGQAVSVFDPGDEVIVPLPIDLRVVDPAEEVARRINERPRGFRQIASMGEKCAE